MPRGPTGARVLAPLTRIILWVNVAIFALEVIESRTIEALMGPSPEVLLAFGANTAPLTLGLGQYDRLLAACFLHGSLLHLAFNMSALWQIGPFVERAVGAARYAVLYVVTGIAASATSVVWGLLRGEHPWSVGASGAICGVMGAAVVVGLRVEGWGSPLARQIGFWLLVTLAFGASVKHIDNAAHVGGLVAGVVLAASWRRGVAYSRPATIACVTVAVLVCVLAGLSTAYRDATDPFAFRDANERGHAVVLALQRGDCTIARRALVATEAVADETPELAGLRKDVESACPPGKP
jgi:rhomboid protease GluP